MIYTTYYLSPIGKLVLSSTGPALNGLSFKAVADSVATNADNLPVFVQTKKWLDNYFSAHTPGDLPPLAPGGTAFQQAVWKLLLAIPYGQTVTYGQLAKQIAQQQGQAHMAAQAIGGAVGKNPIAIIIPCHRVLGTGGKLTGYAAGLDKKIQLLLHEGAAFSTTLHK